MAEVAQNGLAGKRLLVVEDEYMVADDLAGGLGEEGAEVVGPAGTVEDALELVQLNRGRLDGAVLDVNLRDERVYPVADVLASRGVPFVLPPGNEGPTKPS